MTPLARLLTRYLPAAALVPTMALVYAGMIFAVVLLSGDPRPREGDHNPYVDIHGKPVR